MKVDSIRLSQYLGMSRVQAAYMPLKNHGEIDPQDVMAPLDRAPRQYDEESLRKLGEDIRERGQLQPIRVYWSPEYGKWVIVTGERRWRAVLAVNLFRITCVFLDYEPTGLEILAERLVDVLHQEQPDPAEIARNCRDIMNLSGWSSRELAKHLHVSEGKISKYLSLLSLPAEVLDSVGSGKLATSTAYTVSQIADPEQQRIVADMAIASNMTRDQVATMVADSGIETRAKRSTPRKPPRGNRRIIKTSAGVTITLSHRRRLTDQDVSNALREAMNLADRGQQGAA